MTSNPLIAKYEELYGKKEEPKPQKTHTEKLKELRDISTVPVNTPNITTKANHIPSLTTYDVDSCKDSFLQIAELVKQNKAKITSMNMSVDATGELFAKTISFEVMVADWNI
jgi:hypothetical protein